MSQHVQDLEEGAVGEVPTNDTDTDRTIRERIQHILSIYPKISVSMLQIGLGTSLMPALWKPVLQSMIEDGTIIRATQVVRTPSDRQQSYVILSLRTE